MCVASQKSDKKTRRYFRLYTRSCEGAASSDWGELSPKTFKVLFLGAGPGGFAGAVDASQSRRFEVRIYAARSHKTKLEEVRKIGHLQANGSIEGHFKPALYTDLTKAMKEVDIMVNMMPVEAHDTLFKQLSKLHVTGFRCVLVASVFSSPIIKKMVPGIKTFESPTLPYVARWGEGAVNVYDIKKRYILGPTSDLTDEEREIVEQLFSLPIDWQPDGLLANLKAVNLIIHTAPSVIGYDEITEKRGQTHFYGNIMARDDIHPVIEAMSKELVAIQRACGYECHQIEDTLTTLNRNYGTTFKSIKDFAENTVPHNAEYMCPTTLPNHRYLTQDAKHGLVFLCDLAKLLGVKVPATTRVLKGACELMNEDFFKTGRTLASMGLGNATPNDVLKAFGAKHRI